jgi:hypothetical protein
VNHSPKQITIIWHDDDGKEWENTRRTLDPGTELKQDTYLNHAWCVMDSKTGRFIQEIHVTQMNQRFEIH